MAAIVRVKRKINEEPADSLLVSCKRVKVNDGNTEQDAADQLENLFRFAGTVHEKDASVSRQVRDAIRKEKIQKEYNQHQAEYKQHPVDLHGRARGAQKHSAQSNRYKVVAQRRALQLDDLDNEAWKPQEDQKQGQADEGLQQKGVKRNKETEDDHDDEQAKGDGQETSSKMFCLFDIEDQKDLQEDEHPKMSPDVMTCNGVPMVRQKVNSGFPESCRGAASGSSDHGDDQHVYDIYYLNKRDMDFRALENILTIEAFQPDQVLMDDRGDDCAEVYEDEDDSNDEGNWRNDYPDEDPMFFENEDAEYAYGDEPKDYRDHLSGDEYYDLPDDLYKRLTLDGVVMSTKEEDVSSSENEESQHPIDSKRSAIPVDLYAQYKAKVLQEQEPSCSMENT